MRLIFTKNWGLGLIALVCLAMSGGCGDTSDEKASESTTATSNNATSSNATSSNATELFGGVGAPTTAGRHDVTLPWEGVDRLAIIEIPENFDPEESHALIIIFHGGGSKADTMFKNRASFRAIAQADQVITVFPQGTPSNGDGNSWNWADLPGRTSDDVAFVSNLILWMSGPLNINSKRVYTAGFSAGGGMAQRLAGQRPVLIAATMSCCMATGFTTSDPPDEACPNAVGCMQPPVADVETIRFDIGELTSPVPALLIRGGEDRSVCDDGTCSRTSRRYDTVEEHATIWVNNNDCDLNAFETEMLEGEGDSAVIRRFESCTSDAPVHALYMPALEHTWPNSANTLIYNFLMRFENPR